MWGICVDGRVISVTKPDVIKTKGVKFSPSIYDGEVAVGTTDGGASDG